MKCSQIRKKLSAFSDSEVSEKEKKLILEHLKSCDSCRKELEELAQVSDVLNVMDEVQVSPFFITRLKQRIADQKSKNILHLPFLEWMRRAAVPAFVAGLVFLSFLAGSRLGREIYQERVVRVSTSNTEVVDVLGVTALDEFPESSLGWAYNNLLIGGE